MTWQRYMSANLVTERSSAETSQAQPGNSARPAARGGKPLLLPSISDILFIVLLAILFMNSSGWSDLLADGDTGWHIRTGEHILKTHAVPVWDLFSYTNPGTHWYAWEW